MDCVVAIDAGTTGVRALVVDQSGHVMDLAYRELTQHFPQPGWVEHDAGEVWDAVRATLDEVGQRLAENSTQVAAVGITNQRETAVAWDRSRGLPLRRAIVWQDRRTAARCDELRAQGHLPLIRSRTGLVLDPYFSATKYEWLLGSGGLASAGADLALGTVDSWVLFQLTGGARRAAFLTDATNASRTLLYDIHERAWSEELCELFGVPRTALAEVRPSCGLLGRVDPAALENGDSPIAGAPVSAIAGDQHAALVGQACFEPGAAKATYGTGTFLLVNSGSRVPDAPGLLATIAWDLGDLARPESRVAYALEGSTFVSGAAIQWLRDELGIIDRADQVGPLAASVPDSGGLTLVPAFTGLGSPWWDPRARGLAAGITRGTGRGQLARAVVEAMTFQVRDMVEAAADAGHRPLTLRADGGASAVDLLLQLQADQIATPVTRPRCVESSALGAAMLAGLAEGLWDSLDELSALWEPDVRCEPSPDRAVADAAYAAWRAALERARDWASA